MQQQWCSGRKAGLFVLWVASPNLVCACARGSLLAAEGPGLEESGTEWWNPTVPDAEASLGFQIRSCLARSGKKGCV